MAIAYPYLPKGRGLAPYLYVPESNKYMALAKQIAKKYRSNLQQPGAAVVVKNHNVIGTGSIGNSQWHAKGCERVRLNLPTGQGYDKCKGCHSEYHSERQAVFNASRDGYVTHGADLYLWGHWWCCEPCWKSMLEAGIADVYLLEGSERLFNKEHPDNILGRQFD